MREAGGGGGARTPRRRRGSGAFLCVCVFALCCPPLGGWTPTASRHAGPVIVQDTCLGGPGGEVWFIPGGSPRPGARPRRDSAFARAPTQGSPARSSLSDRPSARALARLPTKATHVVAASPDNTTPAPGRVQGGAGRGEEEGHGGDGAEGKKREKKTEMDHAAPPQHHFPFLSPFPHTHTPPQMRTHIAPSARLGGAPAGAVLPVRPARARRAAPRTVSVKAEKVRQTRGRRDASAGVPLSGGSPRLCGLQPARPVPAPPRPAACGATLGIAPHSAAGAGGAGGQAAGGGPQLASLLARKAPEKKKSRRGLLGRRPGPGPGLHLPAIAPHRPLGYVPHAMGWVRWPENVCNCPGRTPRATSFLSDGPQLQHKLTPLPIPPSPSLPLFLPRSSASTSAPPTPPAASWRAASPPSSPTPRAPAPRRPSSPTPRQATAWSAR